MVVVVSSHTSNVNLYRKLPYDTAKDFAPVTQLTANFFFLAVNPSSPVKTVPEFVALAKAKKGALTYASAGNGQGAHLGMELLKTLGGFDAVHVPYNGIGPAAVVSRCGAGRSSIADATDDSASHEGRKAQSAGIDGTQAPGVAGGRSHGCGIWIS